MLAKKNSERIIHALAIVQNYALTLNATSEVQSFFKVGALPLRMLFIRIAIF